MTNKEYAIFREELFRTQGPMSPAALYELVNGHPFIPRGPAYKVVDDAEYKIRDEVCGACPCQQQNCPCLKLNRKLLSVACPQDKWPTLILGDVNLGG